MVKNKLNPSAPVAILVGTPTAEDDVKRKLLSCKAGQKFQSFLSANGILPDDCSYLSLVSERHPTLDRIRPDELLCWQELTRRDIVKINPNIVLAVGELPFKFLTGLSDHYSYRGYICKPLMGDFKVLCIWDYSNFFSNPEWNPLTHWDAAKVKEHMHTKDPMYNKVEVIVTHNLQLIMDEFLSEEYINNPDSMLSFDIECNKQELTCIGFAKETNKAYVIPLNKMHSGEYARAIRVINAVLKSPVKKVAQNGSFDITYLAYYNNIQVNNFAFDTMLAMHSMYSNLPKGLGVLGSVFTNCEPWKMNKGDDSDDFK